MAEVVDAELLEEDVGEGAAELLGVLDAETFDFERLSINQCEVRFSFALHFVIVSLHLIYSGL